MGQPEGDLALAQAVVYLCQAPKSNAVYRAYGAVLKDVAETRNEPVPLHLRNAPTKLMKGMGYGKGYEYAHDLSEGRSEQVHLPPNLEGRIYYEPTERGFESLVRERLAWREERRAASEERELAEGKRRAQTAPLQPEELSPGEEPQDWAPGEESQEPPAEVTAPPPRSPRQNTRRKS
jgi:putative ATPase